MPYYELLCLASGHLNRKELGDVLRKTCQAFMNNGATVTRLLPLGADGNGPRKLAYRIRLNQVSYHTAYFVNVCAFSSPAAVAEVSRQLRIDERVLRHGVFRRSMHDALLPIPDANDVPAMNRVVGTDDPDFQLQKFLHEYQRDFPDGVNITEVQAGDTEGVEVVDENGSSYSSINPQEESVQDILAKLKASAPVPPKIDDDFSWMSKLKKPEPSGSDST